MLHIDEKIKTQKINITELKDNCIGFLGSFIVLFTLFMITSKFY